MRTSWVGPLALMAGAAITFAIGFALIGGHASAQQPPPSPTPRARTTPPPTPSPAPPFPRPAWSPPGMFARSSLPGTVVLPPFGRASFLGPDRNPPTPTLGPGATPDPLRVLPPVSVTIESYSDRPAELAADLSGVTIAVSPDFEIWVTAHDPATQGCPRVEEQANVVRCRIGGGRIPTRIAFTTASRAGVREAALDLSDSRPCIPESGERICGWPREALWQGRPDAWAERGVTDPDAVFNATVLFRVQAGDPAAIGNIARALGWPYLQITRLRFVGVALEQRDEFIEITNLGGGPQTMSGWSIRAPDRGAVFRLRSDLVLRPGQSCRFYTGMLPPEGVTPCLSPMPPGLADRWPDTAGEAILFYDALALPGDAKRYSGDPAGQPPPPHLGLLQFLPPDHR